MWYRLRTFFTLTMASCAFLAAGPSSHITNGSAVLAAEEKAEGRLTAELTFRSVDVNDNGSPDFDEFAAWDPGFSSIANEDGKQDAYVTVVKTVYAIWDRDGDSTLTVPEMRFAMKSDLLRAVMDDDATLNEQELLKNFAIIFAMRTTIRPDL